MAEDVESEKPSNGVFETSENEKENSTHLLEPKFPEKLEDAKSSQITKQKFPKSVFFIVGNEFCERFSYYGLRAVLSIYLTKALRMDRGTANTVYHIFMTMCSFTPLLGSILADGFLGKFRTIFYVSLVYAFGNIALSLTAVPPLNFPRLPMSMVALFLISLGTGGVKPCIPAFGGDQFDNDQIKQREKFFFMFYFSVNAGALISMLAIPVLKDKVECFGRDTCYSLAFGLLAISTILSIILFICGIHLYRIYPPEDNIIVRVSSCIGHAISRRWKTKTKTKNHWLDYADDKFDPKFISDVRAVLRVMFLCIPLPVFCALFELQGSLWTFQAQELDERLTSPHIILPEQMQAINPLLVLIFIPIFEAGVYPLLAKGHILTKQLPRVFVGGLFAAVALIVAGFLQLAIESKYPSNPVDSYTDIVFINNGPCALHIKSLNRSFFYLDVTLDDKKFFSENKKIDIGGTKNLSIEVTPVEGAKCRRIPSKIFKVKVENKTAYTVAFIVHDKSVEMYMEEQLRKKPEFGNASLRLVYNLPFEGDRIMLKKKDGHTECIFDNDGNTTTGITGDNETSDEHYCSTSPGIYVLHLPDETGNLVKTGVEIHPLNGGQYDYNIYASGLDDSQISVNYYVEVAENDINILFQVPQYVILTAGEVMYCITGLEFSYSQCPASTKSVLQAAWLLTDAFGNLLIIFISEVSFFDKNSSVFFLYAGIMILVMLVFAFMASSYVYVTIDREGNVVYPGKPGIEEKESSEGKRLN